MEYVCDLDRESVSEVSQGVIGVKLVTIDEVTDSHERVIRCRDCKWLSKGVWGTCEMCRCKARHGEMVEPLEFCSRGEPREDA